MIVNLKSQTEMSGFYIVFQGSTNLERPGIYGISHLLEHCVCHSFEKYREELERDGIDWNFYTSSNEIVGYFTGLDSYLNKWKSKLLDLIGEFKTTKDKFENEKNIVLQEYTNYFADQGEAHALNLSRKLFKDFDPIGVKEDLEKLKFMDALNFWELQFSNPSKIINISASSPFKSDIEFSIPKNDRTYKFGPYNDVVLEKMNDYGDKASVMMVGPLADSDFAYISFINGMLSTGLSSPLYTEVREKKGLVYYIRCSQSRLNNQGVTSITTQTSTDNVEKVYDAVKGVLDNPKKFMTKSRFETIKDSHLIRLKKEKINRFANIQKWITPPEWSISSIIETVTLDKLMEVYDKYYKSDDFYLSCDKDEFAKNK
jgi:predicted Zn-dependent peptidase